MANFICEFKGSRGRVLKLYDTKIIIITKKTIGSLISGNFTDGEKTIYLCDVVGVQFKKSGNLIGYLQFETPSLQMNNKSDNMFSENTFTFENGRYGITNDLINALYEYITDRIEELKYKTSIIDKIPNFEAMKVYKSKPTGNNDIQATEETFETISKEDFVSNNDEEVILSDDEYIDFKCPNCKEMLSIVANETNVVCPWCDCKIVIK